jgi:hypothetical protein
MDLDRDIKSRFHWRWPEHYGKYRVWPKDMYKRAVLQEEMRGKDMVSTCAAECA